MESLFFVESPIADRISAMHAVANTATAPAVLPVRPSEMVIPATVGPETPRRRLASLPTTFVDPELTQFKATGGRTDEDEGELLDEYTEGNIRLQNIIEGDLESGVVMCLRFSSDGSLLAAGFSNGHVKIYNAEDCQCLHALCCDDRMSVTSIRFCPSLHAQTPEKGHLLLATYASGHVRVWHYTSGTCLVSIDELRQRKDTSSSAFNVTSDKFVTVGADPQIFVYDSETRKRTNVLEATDCTDKMDGHRFRVYAVQFHPNDPNVFVSGGWDNTVQFWDVRERHAFRRLYGPHICGDALDIDPNYFHILTGSWHTDTPLQIWDFGTGEKIRDVPQDRMFGSLLYCAQWIGRENIACGGSLRNMARLIDRGTLNTVGYLVNLPKGVYAMDNNHRDPQPVIAAAASNKIYLLKQVV